MLSGTLPAPRRILDGLWFFTLPLPFQLSSVNVCAVRLPAGDWMLVDTGLGTPDSWAALNAHLDAAGIPILAIKEIFLTHTHPDHVGQAARLVAKTGARVRVQLEELEQLRRFVRAPQPPPWLDQALVMAGVPADLIHRIEGSFAKIRPNFPDLEPDAVLAGGEAIETAIGPLRTILTPGHSPGHLCLYSEAHRLLLAGDHILESITPNIGWLEGRDALGEFQRSLQRVAAIPAGTILPGHGEPFSGHAAWTAATWKHHEDRCAQILDALARHGPRTAHELVGSVWAFPLAPFHHRFAVFEVLAHLEYLRRRGQVTADGIGTAAPYYWRVATSSPPTH